MKGRGAKYIVFLPFRVKKPHEIHQVLHFLHLFTLTETVVDEYNRIDGLYHELHDGRPMRSLCLPIAGVEGGRVAFVHPTMQ